MLTGTAEFICECDESDVLEAYSSLFLEPLAADEWELRTEEEEVAIQIAELKELCSDRRASGELVVFATMVPSGYGRRLIPDISAMRQEDFEEIPRFMQEHPRLEDGDYSFAADGRWLSTPLLMTGLDAITASSAYVPDGVDKYAELTVAALLYELTAFGDGVGESERRRQEISEEIGGAIGIIDAPDDSLDELLFALRPQGAAPEALKSTPSLKELERLRYNARLEMYERMHADVMLAMRTRRS